MRKLLLLFFTVLSLVTIKAQKIGGFGYITLGGAFITSSQIQNRLQEETLFSSDFSFNQPGFHIGVRLIGVYEKLLLGGSGYSNTFTGNSSLGEVNLKAVSRFFNVGCFIVSKPKTKVYTLVGFGSGNSRLRATTAEASMRRVSFGDNQNVSVLSPEVLQKSIAYEFCIGIQRFIIKNTNDYDENNSGFLLGFVAGANLFPSTSWKFKTNETIVANMGNMSSFYIGVTIGGGGFNY